MSRCVRVKICGITRACDAFESVRLGADAVGFVFAPSPRRMKPQAVRKITEELPPFVTSVGVFMDQGIEEVRSAAEQAGVDIVQLHGNEDADYARSLSLPVIKRIAVHAEAAACDITEAAARYPARAFVLDPGKGDGIPFEWQRFKGMCLPKPFIIAGGLRPGNVADAVRVMRPFGVDVSSGVESEICIKDSEKIKQFIMEATWKQN